MIKMKYEVLKGLKQTGDCFVSGESLSKALGVSRTAVWKEINNLKEEGYKIESSSRKGYRLVSSPDIISRDEILLGLNTGVIGKELHCFDELDSTNTYAKKIAFEDCSHGAVVVADRQAAGRGRLGRTWFSPPGKGIWMSVVLKPDIAPGDAQFITLAASVAVAKAIEECCGIKPGIKWPNDIIIRGRKVCGILTELSAELERINFLVVGIGINVNHGLEDFPEDIRDIAGSIRMFAGTGGCLDRGDGNGMQGENANGMHEYCGCPGKYPVRAELIKSILYHLEKYYDMVYKYGKNNDVLECWKEYSVTLGRRVMVNFKDTRYTGVAVDITGDGKLIVSCDDGVAREVMSGEVSVRGVMGYMPENRG